MPRIPQIRFLGTSGGAVVTPWLYVRHPSQVIATMYPRNAASPPRIAIGPVVQISDGAVQTSGVSIKVRPEGEAASAGGGTTAYEEGVVLYTPTQAETNYTAFAVVAYKSGCIPATATVVTTASATSGTTAVNSIANDAITAASIAADVTTELQSGLATASALSTVAGYLDTEVAAILAAVDTEVAAIKAKTDNLPASPAAVGSAMTLESGAITAAVVATGAIDADALATDAVTEIADGILNRDMSTGTDSGSATVRTPRQALRFLRNKWSVSGTTLTVTKEDDATASWTAEVTTDALANPIIASDPASS
jgi:hypothetical protein